MCDIAMNEKDAPFSLFFDLVDQGMNMGHPLTEAMIMAGNRLQQVQLEQKIFDPLYLKNALDDIFILLARRPDFDRKSGGLVRKSGL